MKTTGFPTIDSAITFIETQIEALDARRAKLVSALDGLKLFADGGIPDELAEMPPPGKARPQSPAPRTTKEAGRPNEDKVLKALSGGPLAPKAVHQRTGIPEKSLAHVLRRLLASGQVTKTGKTRKTKYQLTT